jgi:light-regulated signal transduction histidine kinase (bacteriophytochrome)
LFQNLISNALKFRKDVIPEIKISAKEDVDHWFFLVQDNGIGIKEQDKDKIFVLFKRCMIEMNTRRQELAYLIVKNSSVTWYYLSRIKIGVGTVLILQFEKIE